MTTRPTRFAAGALSLLAFSAGPARAAPPSPSAAEARADALFREGTEKLDAGKVDEACAALEESLRLDPELGTLLNLGLCHEKQGKSATAWGEFSDAAAWAADAGQGDRRDFAHEHAANLERGLVRIQLRLPEGERVRVEIDGDAVLESRAVLPLFLDPGHHVLKVTAPLKKPFVTDLDVAPATEARRASATQTVSVPPLADDAATAPAPGSPAPSPLRSVWSLRREVALGLGAASVVGFGLGVFFGAESLSDIGDASAHCSAARCDAQGLSDHGSAKSAEVGSILSFGASVLLLGAGAWLWLPTKGGPGSGVQVVPVVEGKSRGLNVTGTW